MKRSLRILPIILAGSLAGSLEAATISFGASLTTGQEVPSPVLGSFTPSGTAVALLDTDASTLSADLSWTGMTSAVTMAHIHRAATPSPTGPVLVGFFMGESFSQTASFSTGSIALTPVQLQGLLDGLASGNLYFNVHTVQNGPGEIRGDIGIVSSIPEPSAAMLLGSGLAGVIGMIALARRRARA